MHLNQENSNHNSKDGVLAQFVPTKCDNQVSHLVGTLDALTAKKNTTSHPILNFRSWSHQVVY